MAHRFRNADAILARFGARAKGVVNRRRLLAAGLSHDQIAHRVRAGLLVPEYPGVYRVGPPTIDARYMAAVVACGRAAVLSGLAAAWWWGLIKGKPPAPEVSAPADHTIRGLKTRRRRLDRSEVTTHRGIPITSVALTLCDLAPLLALSDLARACHEAGVKHQATPGAVEEALARRPNTRGARNLRAVIHGDQPVTLSVLEERFLALLRAHALPTPTTNKPAGTHRVDCRWPIHRLTVELDSYRFHNSRHAWEQDRRREREANARGDAFRRYTYRDVFEDSRAMLRELRALLVG